MSDLWNTASHFGEYFGIEYSAERAAPHGCMIVNFEQTIFDVAP